MLRLKELGDYINAHYVSIGVDMEAGEGPALANMYPLEGYPTIMFMDASVEGILNRHIAEENVWSCSEDRQFKGKKRITNINK